jgi:hypothetical protein
MGSVLSRRGEEAVAALALGGSRWEKKDATPSTPVTVLLLYGRSSGVGRNGPLGGMDG